MPNDGNAYPGVDPLPPNGLIAAGRILADNIGPVEYFVAWSNAAVTAPSHAGFSPQVTLDISSVQQAVSWASIAVDNITLHITKAGTYLFIASAFPDTGTIGTGQLVVSHSSAHGDAFGVTTPGEGASLDSGWSNAMGIFIPNDALGDTHTITASQNSGSDVDVDCRLLVLRLGDNS